MLTSLLFCSAGLGVFCAFAFVDDWLHVDLLPAVGVVLNFLFDAFHHHVGLERLCSDMPDLPHAP